MVKKKENIFHPILTKRNVKVSYATRGYFVLRSNILRIIASPAQINLPLHTQNACN